MYMACRHIKTNGLRCKSPALKGANFCYYHSKLHSIGKEQYEKFSPMRLPVLEDPAAIQLSLARITDALISGRIDPKKAGQLLYSLQIAAHVLDRNKKFWEEDVVNSATQAPDGDDLAPKLRVCSSLDDCNGCKFAKTCPDYDPDDDDDDDDDDSDDDVALLAKAVLAANSKR